MNLIKSVDFFDPTKISESIHIIGCGAIGSTLAEMLVRMGCTNIHLYDFDIVTAHNLANQMFRDSDIGTAKTTALENILKEINPEVAITTHPAGWTTETKLSGYVFLAVDDITLRKTIATENIVNMAIKAMFDFRMGLSTAEHFAVNWEDMQQKQNFIKGMDFTSDEAAENAPRNACGTTLNIISTVRTIVSIGITNFIKLYKSYGQDFNKIIMIDSVKPFITII